MKATCVWSIVTLPTGRGDDAVCANPGDAIVASIPAVRVTRPAWRSLCMPGFSDQPQWRQRIVANTDDPVSQSLGGIAKGDYSSLMAGVGLTKRDDL
jgi:hypothetical protein